MNERNFGRIFRRDWFYFFPDSHFIKIPDSIRGSKHRFIPFKPYDNYALFEKKFFALELKYQRNFRAIPFKHFHQTDALLKVRENGGKSYYGIGIESEKGEELFRLYKQEGKYRMMFFLNPDYPRKWEERTINLKNKKSVRIEELFYFADFVITRRKNEGKLRWELDEFWKWLNL